MLRFRYLVVLMFVAVVASAQALAAEASSPVKVQGTLGIAHSLENSCIAVWITVPDEMAVGGIKWYNNDGTVAFPEILVQSGRADSPVDLPDAVAVAENVLGQSSAWSEVTFTQGVESLSGGLYVIFRVPADAPATARGVGGGPAIGYTVAGQGVPGWMSSDGLEWEPLHPNYGFAVQAVFVAGSGGLSLKSAKKPDETDGGSQSGADTPTPQIYVTTLHPAYPNPFNPQTTLRYSVHETGMVDLAVFNIRGELVKHLVSESRGPGEYTVTWKGQDRSGAQLASGVYFARLVSGPVTMTQRLVLVQ